jgi:hypothetical protein
MSILGQIAKIFEGQTRRHAWIDIHGEGQRREECTNTQDNKNEMRERSVGRHNFWGGTRRAM